MDKPQDDNKTVNRPLLAQSDEPKKHDTAIDIDNKTKQRTVLQGFDEDTSLDVTKTVVNPVLASQQEYDSAETVLAGAQKRAQSAELTSVASQDETVNVSPSDLTLPNEPLPSAPSPKEQTTIHIGYVIRDRFVIKKILGAGGMGAVYQALDLRKQEAGDNDPYIAIKVLKGDFQYHEDAFVTMQREAKKTNALAHPNIVTVYDFDREKDLIYLTMEQLKGHPLDEIIKGQTSREISEAQAYSIIEQLAKGLSYAHSKGIVHSDLKPANIFLTTDNQVKILDFGIARAVNEELYDDSFDAGKLGALTLAYASLEMINYQDPHPSDDIYALGVIIYELLWGQHPFNRKNAKQVFEQNIKPIKTNLKNIFLRRCIAQTIAISREDRIADAGQFLKRFQRSRTILRKIAIATAAVIIVSLVNTFYISTIDTQIVPFDSLSKGQQTQFFQAIKEGETALLFNDLQGAVMHFNQAYGIHKTHSDMKKAQKTIMAIMGKNLNEAPENQKEFIEEQMRALEEYPAFRPENIELNK